MNWQDIRGNAVTHRIERCQFIGNRVNDSLAIAANAAGAAALFLHGTGAARQTCVRDEPPTEATRGWNILAQRIAAYNVHHCHGIGK